MAIGTSTVAGRLEGTADRSPSAIGLAHAQGGRPEPALTCRRVRGGSSRTCGKRPQRELFVANEARQRRLVHRAVLARIGPEHPLSQVPLELDEGLEGPSGDGVSLHVLHWPSVLRLQRARYGPHARGSTSQSRRPSPCGRRGSRGEDDRSGDVFAPEHQRLDVVAHHRARDAAEVGERLPRRPRASRRSAGCSRPSSVTARCTDRMLAAIYDARRAAAGPPRRSPRRTRHAPAVRAPAVVRRAPVARADAAPHPDAAQVRERTCLAYSAQSNGSGRAPLSPYAATMARATAPGQRMV